MTEISKIESPLPEAVEDFVLEWGNMGSAWGVNRSVSQIHALLYLAEAPMTAEEISEKLGLARSNVSNSIKELMTWRLIHKVPQKNDRRDHFAAETDVWKIADYIAAGRKAREIDPAVEALRGCAAKADADDSLGDVTRARLKRLLEFTESIDDWYTQMLSIPVSKRARLLRMGAKIVSFIPGISSAKD